MYLLDCPSPFCVPMNERVNGQFLINRVTDDIGKSYSWIQCGDCKHKWLWVDSSFFAKDQLNLLRFEGNVTVPWVIRTQQDDDV